MTLKDYTIAFSGDSVDITPTSPLPLAGYRRRKETYTHVAQPLEANAVVLRSADWKVAIVQLDVLSAGFDVRNEILKRLSGKLRDEELFLLASHTHYAPGIDSRLPELGRIDRDYVAFVLDRISSLLSDVLDRHDRPTCIRYADSACTHAISRRKLCWAPAAQFPPIKRSAMFRPNPRGFIDTQLRTVSIYDRNDNSIPCAVLWNYACHPVGHSDVDALSSSYPGVVREQIRRNFGCALPVVFLPGFMGDARPKNIVHLPKTAVGMVRRMLSGPVFGNFTDQQWAGWTSTLTEQVLTTISEGNRVDAVSNRVRRATQPMAELMHGEPDDRPISYHLVELGPVRLLGISAEPVADYAKLADALSAGRTLIPVGYIDGIAGYLPTSEQIPYGGIEVISPGFSLGSARYKENVSEIVLDQLRKVTSD